jgi:photosystem II stability/assembly factor-like uncharacterized protein
MQMPTSRSARARLGIVTALALLGSVLLTAPALAGGGGGKDHFKPSSAGEGGEAAETLSVAGFESEAAKNPVHGSAALFSQCRFDPLAHAVYPALAPNEHDVIDHDSLFTFADGVTQCYNPQNEQNIVVNPTNRLNVVTTANDYRLGGVCVAYVSEDGGATWLDYIIGGWSGVTFAKGQFIKTGCGGDPVLAFAPDGTLYYAGVTFNIDKFPRQMSGVAVSKSPDGGKSWTAPVMVAYNAAGNFFADKPWISVSNDGTLNLTWTKFYQGPKGLGYVRSPIVMSQSKNGGKSWSSVKEVSDPSHPYDQGSQSAMAPDGTLYVTYEGGDPVSGYATDAMMVASSTDGGATFTNHNVARIFDDLDCYPIQEPGGQDRQTLTNEQFRLFLAPMLAIDPTNGRIVLTWTDNEGVGSCGNGGTTFTGTTSNQVKVLTSTNGSSWTLHRITNSAPDKFFSSVGANDGQIAVAYYTRDYAIADTGNTLCEAKLLDGSTITVERTDNVCIDTALKVSTDGGDTWSSQIRISSHSSNPYTLFAGSFIGDYEGTAVDDQGKVYTVWTDNRGNPGTTAPNQDTYVGTIPND